MASMSTNFGERLSIQRMLSVGLLILCAFSLPVAALNAQEPDEPLPPPLFGPELSSAEELAPLVVGVGSYPANGAWATTSALLLGTTSQLSVWEIRGPSYSPRQLTLMGAATLVLNGCSSAGNSSLSVVSTDLSTLHVGDWMDVWTLRDPDTIIPLSAIWLPHIQDVKPIPHSSSANPEIMALYDAITKASQTSEKAFLKHADREVTISHLLRDPQRYRADIVYIKGRLQRLRRFPAPTMLKYGGDVEDVYEGWIFKEGYGTKAPYCVLFTDLPEGIEVAEDLGETHVEFAGYFFKAYRYQSAEQAGTKQAKLTPLLVGRTLRVTKHIPPVMEEKQWIHGFLYFYLAALVTLGIAAFFVVLWYRRGDRGAQTRIVAARASSESELVFENEGVPTSGTDVNIDRGTSLPPDGSN